MDATDEQDASAVADKAPNPSPLEAQAEAVVPPTQCLLSNQNALRLAPGALFYTSAHTGVIYDYSRRQQKLLQGHCHPISCCVVSEDKRWIVTADRGDESMIVVWDSITGNPIKTIFHLHLFVVQAIDISPDALFLVALSAIDPSISRAASNTDQPPSQKKKHPRFHQELSVWEWTAPAAASTSSALYSSFVVTEDVQHAVRFNTYDIREIVTNGKQRVIFWNWQEQRLLFYSPSLSRRDFRQVVGDFTMSIFVPDSKQALTGTEDGDLVLWDAVHGDEEDDFNASTMLKATSASAITGGNNSNRFPDRKAVKIVRLAGGSELQKEVALTFIADMDGHLILGSSDGAVRFYDFDFRLVTWFEDMNAGAITSVSTTPWWPRQTSGTTNDHEDEEFFLVPDFVVATSSAFVVGMTAALFAKHETEKRRGTPLMQNINDAIHGLAAHPMYAQLALSSYSGVIQLWDYTSKRLIMMRKFEPERFHARGHRDVSALEGRDHGHPHQFELESVCGGRCEPAHGHVAREICRRWWRRWRRHRVDVHWPLPHALEADHGDGVLARERWESAARVRERGQDHGRVLPQSLEYSRWHRARAVTRAHRAERDADGVLLEPGDEVAPGRSTAGREQRVQGQTVKWNTSSKTCRKTTLGPSYGGPINRLVPLPVESVPGAIPGATSGAAASVAAERYCAYSTHEKVVGLLKLPLDRNPHKTMGLIAHPGEVSNIDVSFDGSFLMTAGGSDLAANMWEIDTNQLDFAEATAGSTPRRDDGTSVVSASYDAALAPYVSLLEGGFDGEFYHEIVDYFYLAQLRVQGENATSSREITTTIPLREIPNVMRALGFYPTDQEIHHMCNEVKCSRFTETTEAVETITLPEFIKLYMNHRPVFGIGKAQIEYAFQVLASGVSNASLRWETLERRLLHSGEAMSDEELRSCLNALIVADEGGRIAMDASYTALSFADKVWALTITRLLKKTAR
ncbi:Wd repeat-containing protein 66, partial [Globisporangium splendens]